MDFCGICLKAFAMFSLFRLLPQFDSLCLPPCLFGDVVGVDLFRFFETNQSKF